MLCELVGDRSVVSESRKDVARVVEESKCVCGCGCRQELPG